MNNSFAQFEIKLTCTLSLIHTYNDGTKEHEREEAIFDISQIQDDLFILSRSDKLSSVITSKLGAPSMGVTNLSDKNRWEIINMERSIKSNKINTTRISIDRNTGKIAYLNNFEEGRLVTQGRGDCSKVDTVKKKF